MEDPEYRRRGQATLFLAYAPFTGWRTIAVTETRTRLGFVAFLRDLVAQYPGDRPLTIVLDNLNTHPSPRAIRPSPRRRRRASGSGSRS